MTAAECLPEFLENNTSSVQSKIPRLALACSCNTSLSRGMKAKAVSVNKRALFAAACSLIIVYALSAVHLHSVFILQSDHEPFLAPSTLLRASHRAYGYEGSDVFRVDRFVLDNIRAAREGARSRVEPDGGGLQAVPLMASVDRRPIVVRKQLTDDARNLTGGGELLGCAMTATTFVTDIQRQDVRHERYASRHSCQLCFQFSSRRDMAGFLPGVPTRASEGARTKCIAGAPSVHAHHAKWQQQEEQKGERFQGFGYPWTVDCILPSGIQELTCRHVSRMQRSLHETPGLLGIHLETEMVLGTSSQPQRNETMPATVTILSKWPWAALTSHDDDRSKIASKISRVWNDGDSWYVPKTAQEMQLAHVEGPGFDGNHTSVSSRGGVHVRLLVNLYHFIRNAPGSTHIIAVVDGQARQSYRYLIKTLGAKISILYPDFWQSMLVDIKNAGPTDLIPMHKNSNGTTYADITLADLLRLRNIQILMVPILTPSLLLEKSVCAGQYQFTTYLAARYSADYQAIMFIDGDTALMEKSKTHQQIFYERLFSPTTSTKCVGHRFQLIEQYVPLEDDDDKRVLECIYDLASHPEKWEYAMNNCHLKEGHIVGRTDAIYAYEVHHTTTLAEYLPIGLEDCTPGAKFSERFYLLESETVQLHLRDRKRKPECTCFVNRPL